jgi:hypothetical protein
MEGKNPSRNYESEERNKAALFILRHGIIIEFIEFLKSYSGNPTEDFIREMAALVATRQGA